MKDINPAGGSVPQQLTKMGGTLFFSADNGNSGRELWKSDGTELGTGMADLNPGAGSSSPYGFVRLGRQMLFAASDGALGLELWRLRL